MSQITISDDGTEIVYIDENDNTRRLRSEKVFFTTGKDASIWIEGNDLVFINENGEKRRVIEPKVKTELD